MKSYQDLSKRLVDDLHTIVKKSTDDVDPMERFQRVVGANRVKKIRESIDRWGWWPHRVIIIDKTNDEVVDGQHGIVAAFGAGIKSIYCAEYVFDTIEDQAQFWIDVNNWNSKQTVLDMWHARRFINCPVAHKLYLLCDDPDSPFYKNIKLKNSSVAINAAKFSLGNIIQLYNTIQFGMRGEHWQNDDNRAQARHESAFRDANLMDMYSYGYDFLRWFNIFAENNGKWYNSQVVPAIANIYQDLKVGGYFETVTRTKGIAKKLIDFDTDRSFVKCPRLTKMNLISEHLRRNYPTALADFMPNFGNR